jgi:glycine amidinotransferase
MIVVNSWNEWDPLREVIVGSARGAADIGYEPALLPYFQPGDAGRSFRGQGVPAVLVDEAERQLDHFVTLLDRLGSAVPIRSTTRSERRHQIGRSRADMQAPVRATRFW